MANEFFVLYTYLRPILMNITHVSGIAISGIFLLFRLASALDNVIGGYSTDRWEAVRVLFVALVCLFLSIWVARRGYMRSTPGEEIPAIVHMYEPVETLPRSRK